MEILKNGKIIPMVGEPYEGDIAIENGKIHAMGVNLDYPNAEEINVSGCFVLPGFVDAHCHIGMWEDGIGFEGADGNDSYKPVTPELRAIDGINPFDNCFTEARAAQTLSAVSSLQ